MSRPNQAWYRKHRERDPCPPKPPPPLPPLKVPYFLIGTGLTLLITAGYIVYARNDPEIRDWLTINAPWFDDIIAAVFEENVPIIDSIISFGNSIKNMVDEYLRELPEECVTGVPPPKPVSGPAAAAVTGSGDDDDDDDDDDEDDEDEDDDDEEVDEHCAIPNPRVPVVTKDVCQVEQCLKANAEDAMYNYMTARDYCDYYNEAVRACMVRFTIPCMNQILQHTMAEKEEVVKKYVANGKSALKRFNGLVEYVNCGVDVPKDRLEVTQQMAKDFADRIKRIQIEYKQRYLRSQEYDRRFKMVKCFIDQYLAETTSMYPELDYCAETPTIVKDLDYLLLHTKKHVDNLLKELIDNTMRITNKINRTYQTIPVEKDKQKERDNKLQAAVIRAKADMDKDYCDRLAEIKKDLDEEYKRKLKKQQELGEAWLKDQLEKKEAVTNIKADKLYNELVTAEKRRLKILLDDMKIKLVVVEQKLEERINAECESKRAQMLHRASTRLLEATKHGDGRVKVAKELEVLRNYSTHDKLVTTVLNAIPSEVETKGVVPETIVKNRYKSMEDIALKVAMVEAEGAPLPLYAFSWIQSKFLLMKMTNIPQVELDNPPQEPFEGMDTFDLLQRARYFLEQGNLAHAVRYVDALQGASRGAAESWFQSANALLQTRQAAEAILAHAAAITLKYI